MAEMGRLLEGRRAIVTGASRGIGAETARAMGQDTVRPSRRLDHRRVGESAG